MDNIETKRNNSKKRQAIYKALCASYEHPTAEMLYAQLKPDYPELSLGTVYRNLAVLTEEGLAVNVANVDGQERYDGRTEPHAHFVCRQCRRVSDLNIENTGAVRQLYREIDSRYGCAPERHSLTFEGLCKDCREPKS